VRLGTRIAALDIVPIASGPQQASHAAKLQTGVQSDPLHGSKENPATLEVLETRDTLTSEPIQQRAPLPHLDPARKQSSIAKSAELWMQSELGLRIISAGLFEKCEPTIIKGEDLDIPTYIRRGTRFN